MDCSAKGEVVLQLKKPPHPHLEHGGCLRIKKRGTLSRPFVQEQPRGDPPCCRKRLQTDTYRKAQRAAQRLVSRWKTSNPRAADGLQKNLSRQGGLTFLRTALIGFTDLPCRGVTIPGGSQWESTDGDFESSNPYGNNSLFGTHKNLKPGTAIPFLLRTQKITRP